MKKAIVIAPVYPLNQPEKEDYINLPAKILKQLGLGVQILTVRKKDEAKEEVIDGFKVKRFSNFVTLLWYALKERPLLIHTFLRPYPASLFAALLPGKKVHTAVTYILGSSKPIAMLSLFLLKRFNKILALTPYETEVYRKNRIPSEKVERIPLPVNIDLFSKPKSQAKGLKILKLKKKPFIITCVANFRGIKRVDVLIKAFSIVKKTVDAKLVLIGKDCLAEEGKPTIKQMAQDKDVIHLGFLEGEDIKAVLDVTDVFCMASNVEPQCLTIYEAGTNSIPLCLSNLESFTTVFKDSALYHQVGDAEKLAEDIIKYYKDPELRKANGKKAKKFSEVANYNVVHKKMEEMFRKLLL
ncbi:hypothetical protein CMO88_00965 [Candidatus Woesearchaeota archaeon]|nr:hypothetical protein [Candidatus Woesearchaeota archaeon]|tara:strand:- start:1546 stop:2610 length:1065 start_codon:yes stop_codon:yes gene_type:complete